MKNALIIGCGLLGSSLLRRISKKKIAKKIFVYEKLKKKGILLRSTEDGYKIKNMLRLTVGSKNDNIKFMKAVESIFNKWKMY